jgi:ribose transport system ATP-binding protein
MSEPLLQMHAIVKQFPGVRALDGVDLEVAPAEVHCMLGQNGAGKSTLIKVLAGVHHPDEGSISWQGEEVRLANPIAAMRLGIATIYQELDLVDGLSVTENIYLGHEMSTLGFSNRAGAQRAAEGLLARLGHPEISPNSEVGRLSAAGQQIVSMARALSHDVKLIVMDEPSAVLDQEEVHRLFGVIRDLTEHGVAVVYISHRLEEIREIGDRVTVLKDGRTVAIGLPAKETPTAEVIRLMTGRSIEYVFPPRRPQPAANGAVLEVRDLTRPGEFYDISFDVRPGEVYGLAGLVGSGRSEILETVFGARKAKSGTVSFHGRRPRAGSVGASVSAGMGMAPEERKSQALLLNESIINNLTVASLAKFSRASFVQRGNELTAATEQVEALDIRPHDPTRDVRTLSGGNQQKVVLGRWLIKGCTLLLLDEPTRGVDVGARSEIYALIRQLADDDVAVLLVSSEVPEVLGLADRVLVLREGRAVYEGPAEDIDEHRVLDLVMEGSAA